MQGKKKVLKNSEISVFRTDDNLITIEIVLTQLKSSADVLSYLPDKPDIYARDRQYLFSLVHTIDTKFFQRLITNRKEAAKSQEPLTSTTLPKILKIDSKMFELLQQSVISRS